MYSSVAPGRAAPPPTTLTVIAVGVGQQVSIAKQVSVVGGGAALPGATLEYIVNDRPLATLLLSAGHTPDVDASERLDMFFTEVRSLLQRALETGMEIGLVRKCQPELIAAAMLGMTRGVIELLVRRTDKAHVDEVVTEMLMVALRGVLA